MPLRSRVVLAIATLLAFSSSVGLSACGDGRTPASDSGTPGDGGSDAGITRTPICTAPAAVPCTDESVLDLALFTAASSANITNTPEGAGFATHVDATGGGFSPTQSYVYARFTDTGLTRVDIGDEAAFDSMDWDIAFRRFVIRLNSGPSGPSCVSGARTASGTDFDTLAAVPDALEYRTEEYYTGTCEMVPDGSGLMSPGVALQSFWEYPGCVQMSGNVYVIRLANGRRLKLTVTSYYEPAVQETCDTTGAIDMMTPSGAGNIRLRWAFLEP
ncbi:MAG: HmuY family protein [Sandaracinaceae bacterium]|nr:HmuY family protein [Sandaracinaceae bacterium]